MRGTETSKGSVSDQNSRLQDETARVEDELLKPEGLDALLRCFVTAKANSFENLLDPFLKISRISNGITVGIAKSQFINRIVEKLSHNKAVVRVNLLRLLRTLCDVHPNRAVLVERYGLYDVVHKLSREDGAVLVRELAREILPSLAPAIKPLSGRASKGAETPGRAIAPKKKMRRTASDTQAGLPASFGGFNARAAGRSSGLSKQRLDDIPWQQGDRK